MRVVLLGNGEPERAKMAAKPPIFASEYDISLVRGGHLEGPNVFGFLIHAFPIEIWCQMQRTSNHGERNNLSTYLSTLL